MFCISKDVGDCFQRYLDNKEIVMVIVIQKSFQDKESIDLEIVEGICLNKEWVGFLDGKI